MSGSNSQKNGAGMPLEGPNIKKIKVESSVVPAVAVAVAPTPTPAVAPVAAATYPTQQQLLQQQIQQQLQQQLQAQLQAAAAKGQQAHITPAQIQAQAQAMVQAAAQAQAVVAAAKSRGDGLVPMNAAQIAALSQIQAQAIVHARPSTALIASGASATGDAKAEPTPAQIQNQIQLQAQALIHAHTQAQIAAGIYKGNNNNVNNNGNKRTPVLAKAPPPVAVAPKTTTTYKTATLPLTATQIAQQSNTTTRQGLALQQLKTRHQAETDQSPAAKARQAGEWQALLQAQKKEGQDLEKTFARQNAAAEYAGVKRTPATTTGMSSHHSSIGGPSAVSSMAMSSSMGGQVTMSSMTGRDHAQDSNMGEGLVSVATSPEFFARLGESLSGFWTDQLGQISALPNTETEQDFKNHNDLPLARIKRIMKSDEDVRMISAEAPVLFAKACEVFILELTLRSWAVSQHNKRRTLQKEDIREAIVKTDVFDFLVDVIH